MSFLSDQSFAYELALFSVVALVSELHSVLYSRSFSRHTTQIVFVLWASFCTRTRAAAGASATPLPISAPAPASPLDPLRAKFAAAGQAHVFKFADEGKVGTAPSRPWPHNCTAA